MLAWLAVFSQLAEHSPAKQYRTVGTYAVPHVLAWVPLARVPGPTGPGPGSHWPGSRIPSDRVPDPMARVRVPPGPGIRLGPAIRLVPRIRLGSRIRLGRLLIHPVGIKYVNKDGQFPIGCSLLTILYWLSPIGYSLLPLACLLCLLCFASLACLRPWLEIMAQVEGTRLA